MSHHYPAIVVAVPFLTALVVAMVQWVNRKWCFPLSLLALVTALGASVGLLQRVMNENVVYYKLGGWVPPIGINYRVDHLNALVLVVVITVALLNLIATRRNVIEEFQEKTGTFYALYMLFVTGLLGIVVTGDAFNLYVLLEIASLTGYALIGLGQDRAPLSGLHYLFMGTIGASFYLLGVGYLYLVTGSLNMEDLATLLASQYQSGVVLFAFFFCLTGLFVKMAFFPLHAWLPNAYAYAPPVSASLIAPLTTKVMIYVMIRISLTVFTPVFTFKVLHLQYVMVWLAVIAIVMGSLFALAQKTFRRMLTYIVVAEVGYMVGGFWLANRSGIAGSILHIVNDAMMTLCLFLVAGVIAYKLKDDQIVHMQGLFRRMPFSMAAMVLGALSIIGIPPTCGFFSKWYLISGGISAGQYGFVVALLFSSLVNVVLFFRIFEIGHFEPFADHDDAGHSHGPKPVTMDEAPLEMVVPLLIVAVGLLVLGLYSGIIVTELIYPVIPADIL